jgi:hypothetical protein
MDLCPEGEIRCLETIFQPIDESLQFCFVNQRRQGGEIGRRARLRIPKTSISKRSFSFQKAPDLRGENAMFDDRSRVHDR